MDDYQVLNKIGDGTFGTVYLCKKKAKPSEDTAQASHSQTTDSQLVAVKKMKKRYHNWDDCMKLREIKALKKLNHHNIVLLKEVIRENDHLYLVFEYMEENLYQLIRNQLVPFPETTINYIIEQILNGLAYIHRKGFFHRDIKPENLLCRNGTKSIKIADFGLTREINSQPPYTDYVSTRWYRAPELLLHATQYNWPVDIWAVGCIAGELFSLRPMFPGRSEIDQIFKICQVLGPPRVESWEEGAKLTYLSKFDFPNVVPMDLTEALKECPEHSLKMIRTMLKWVPSERPRAEDILANDLSGNAKDTNFN